MWSVAATKHSYGSEAHLSGRFLWGSLGTGARSPAGSPHVRETSSGRAIEFPQERALHTHLLVLPSSRQTDAVSASLSETRAARADRMLAASSRSDTTGRPPCTLAWAANAGVGSMRERLARPGRTFGSSRRSAGLARLAKVLNKLEKAHVGTCDRSKFAHQAVSLRRIREFLTLPDRSHTHRHHHRVAIGAFVKLGRHETSVADDHASHSVGDPSG